MICNIDSCMLLALIGDKQCFCCCNTIFLWGFIVIWCVVATSTMSVAMMVEEVGWK